MSRSLVYSILKCGYGWNKCCKDEEQAIVIDTLIKSLCGAEVAPASIAALVANELFITGCGFSPRIDGERNTHKPVSMPYEQWANNVVELSPCEKSGCSNSSSEITGDAFYPCGVCGLDAYSGESYEEWAAGTRRGE